MEREFGISVEAVLQMEALAGSKVLAGRDGLQRIVTSVNVMEVPDIVDWVAAGDMLVTTAYSVKNDVEALLEIIPRLNTLGVVALGIKTDRYIGKVPQAVIEKADQLSFPIFEIPPQISFSAIISSTLTNIVNKQTQVLKEIQELHRSLTSAMLNGGNLQEICEILFQRFGNSVAISNGYFSSFVASAKSERLPYIYDLLEEEKRRRFQAEQKPQAPGSYRVADRVGPSSCNRIVVPIYSEKILYGNIYMWEDFRKISSVEQSAIESTTSLIALDMMKKMSMLEMENNNKTGFLNDLLSSDRKQHQKAVINARYFDFDLKASHQVMLLRLRKMKQNYEQSGAALYGVKANLISMLRHMAKSTSMKIIFANRGNSIVLVCEAPSGNAAACKQTLASFAANLHDQLRLEGLSGLVVLGIGRSCAQSGELYKSLAEARRATACPRLAQNGSVFFEDMGIYRLLSYEGLRGELDLFYEEMLSSLLHYDREKDSELIKTLATYFSCRGNLTRVAEEMTVHYNTIVYRLQRIKELTHLSLDSEQDVLNLQVALAIHEMRKNE